MKRKKLRTLKLFFVFFTVIFSQTLPFGLDIYSSTNLKKSIEQKCLKKNFKSSLNCIKKEYEVEISGANTKIGSAFYILSMYQLVDNFKSLYLKKIGLNEESGYRYIAMGDLAVSSIRFNYFQLASRVKTPLYAPMFLLIDDKVFESKEFRKNIKHELEDIEKEVKVNLPLKIPNYRDDEDVVYFINNSK